MTEITATVSLKKKIELSKGLLLVAQSADFFKEDKKLLKSLAVALKKQQKTCANSVYPMSEADRSEINLLTCDLGEIVLNLAKVKQVSDFQVWNARLDTYTDNIAKKLEVMSRKLMESEDHTVATQVKNVQDNVVETVKKKRKTKTEYRTCLFRGIEQIGISNRLCKVASQIH